MKQEKVFFVVYRPEWWGCFDSLCKQECSQEHVTCYVMSVPRYERDTDTGALDVNKKHFHPEMLTELPSNAILLDYESVSAETDFANKQFDRIYIHNPYDDKCAVDSVDEAYYSENLKKWAEELIYVPHHLYIGGMPESMVYCPVYEYVDTILLSDERVRYSLDVAYDHKVKLVPSGILEYLDKLNAKKETRQATAQSGQQETAKKRLLYCVSFDDLYYGTEKQIQKMWDIFKYMPTREDIEFVFRPDEDIAARFGELEPNIVKRYQELCAYFKENRVGICDEGLNPYTVAAEADGIMTTGHPMSSLFSVQGKYVLCVDRESRLIPTEEDRCIPSIWAATVEEKDGEIIVWFVPDGTNRICRMVLSSGQVEIVAEVPEEGAIHGGFGAMLLHDGCLYFTLPGQSDLWKYIIKTRSFEKKYLQVDCGGYFTRAIAHEDSVYFLPGTFPGIAKWSTKSGLISILDGWVKPLELCAIERCKNEPFFFWAFHQENNILYLASAKSDNWMMLDLGTEEWSLEKMQLPEMGIADMIKKDDEVYLIPVGCLDVVVWNCCTKESKVLYTATAKEESHNPYAFLVDMEEKAVALPHIYGPILSIGFDEGDAVEEITDRIPCKSEDFLSEYLKQRNSSYQFAARTQIGKIIVYECYDGSFFVLDSELRIIEKRKCRFPLREIQKQADIKIDKRQCVGRYEGLIGEGECMQEVFDYFVEWGEAHACEIRNYYLQYLKG